MNFMNKNKISVSRANTSKLLDWSNHFFPLSLALRTLPFGQGQKIEPQNFNFPFWGTYKADTLNVCRHSWPPSFYALVRKMTKKNFKNTLKSAGNFPHPINRVRRGHSSQKAREWFLGYNVFISKDFH